MGFIGVNRGKILFKKVMFNAQPRSTAQLITTKVRLRIEALLVVDANFRVPSGIIMIWCRYYI